MQLNGQVKNKVWLKIISIIIIQAFLLSNAQISFAAFNATEKSPEDSACLAPDISMSSNELLALFKALTLEQLKKATGTDTLAQEAFNLLSDEDKRKIADAQAPKILKDIFGGYDIRGVGDTSRGYPVALRPVDAYNIGRSIGSTMPEGSTFLVTADHRLSSPDLRKAFVDGLTDVGINVDFTKEAVPTGATSRKVLADNYDGAIQVTGSHNPPDNNGGKITLKMDTEGNPSTAADAVPTALAGDALKSHYQKIVNKEFRRNARKGKATEITGVVQEYADALDKILPKFKNKFRVVVDAGNGLGTAVIPLLKKRGVQVDELFTELDGTFPNHPADPSKDHPTDKSKSGVKYCQERVKELNSNLKEGETPWIGLTFDGDGDRSGIIDEKGNAIFPDVVLIPLYQRMIVENLAAIKKLNAKGHVTKLCLDVRASAVVTDIIGRYEGADGEFTKAGYPAHRAFVRAEIEKISQILKTNPELQNDKDVQHLIKTYTSAEASGHYFYATAPQRYPSIMVDDGIFSAIKLMSIVDSYGEVEAKHIAGVEQKKKFTVEEVFSSIKLKPIVRDTRIEVKAVEGETRTPNEIKEMISKEVGKKIREKYAAQLKPVTQMWQEGGFNRQDKNSGIVSVDGTRAQFKDGSWILVRPSGTSPNITLGFEADTRERLIELIEEVIDMLGEYENVGLDLTALKEQLAVQQKILEKSAADSDALNLNYRLLDAIPELTKELKPTGDWEAVLFHGVVNVKSNKEGLTDDPTRLDNMAETLRCLLNNNFTPILIGHNGSAKKDKDTGEWKDNREELNHVYNYLKGLVPPGMIVYHKGCRTGEFDESGREIIDVTKDEHGNSIQIVPGKINLLNNVRLDKEQGKLAEKEGFAQRLMSLTGPRKIYVADDFADIGSKGASVEQAPFYAKEVYVGPAMLREFNEVRTVLKKGIKGLIFGSGEKLDDKIPLLQGLLQLLHEDGYALMGSAPTKALKDNPELLKELKAIAGDRIVLADDFSDETGFDIGPKTIAKYKAILDKFGKGDILLANGTMGFMEHKVDGKLTNKYTVGSKEVFGKLKDIAQRGVKNVVVGGDGGSTAKRYGLDKEETTVTFTGGGVPLKVFVNKLLTGIKALAAVQNVISVKQQFPDAPEIIIENIVEGVISQKEHLDIIRTLLLLNQAHLFEEWDEPGVNDEKKIAFLNQMVELDKNYPEGLAVHQKNAKALLEKSARGENPFDGFVPELPEGVQIKGVNDDFIEKQDSGLKQVNKTAFVMVAGGVGDRLGYDGIKIDIPISLITMDTYLTYYISCITEMQRKSNKLNNTGEDRIPFVIMTSNDTHEMTVDVLKEKGYSITEKQGPHIKYWELEKGDSTIYIVKQGMVPAMVNNNADFTLEENNPYKLATKPHGHGDVHMLLYQSGLVQGWVNAGITHTVFFQDTNAQVMNGILPSLSVSHNEDFDFNFITVPREAGEAAGSIAKLVKEDGTSMIGNVEYNQIKPLLNSIGKDDVPDETGKSPYPGNLNVFIVKNTAYNETLKKMHGIIGEFINPKYTDETKTAFKKPTRLETMMQDLAFVMEKVGFTNFRDKRLVFSPVKNDLVSAAQKPKSGNYPDAMPTGEADFYKIFRRFLELAGVKVTVEGKEMVTRQGVPYTSGAKVVLNPNFAITVKDVEQKVTDGAISDSSTLVINGEKVLWEYVNLDGALVVNVANGALVDLLNVTIENAGWDYVDLTDSQMHDVNVSAGLKVRGYYLEKKEQFEINMTGKGNLILENVRVKGNVIINSEYDGVMYLSRLKGLFGYRTAEKLILENIVINIDKNGNITTTRKIPSDKKPLAIGEEAGIISMVNGEILEINVKRLNQLKHTLAAIKAWDKPTTSINAAYDALKRATDSLDEDLKELIRGLVVIKPNIEDNELADIIIDDNLLNALEELSGIVMKILNFDIQHRADLDGKEHMMEMVGKAI